MNVTFTKVQNDWLEASFYEMVQLPDVEVPAKPALFDADGKEVQAAEPAGTEPGAMQRVEVAFVSYHPTQIDMLRADAAKHGADLAKHEAMLADWVAAYAPPPQPVLTPEELLANAKAARHAAIAAITVTTSSGNVFDGDEKSQDRMARALTAMDDADVLPWVLHDNTVAVVGRSELREALRLAGAEMAAIWVGVYA